MRTKHLFFDLDRTLWDFEKNSEIALETLFKELELQGKIEDFHSFHSQYKEYNSQLWKLYGAGKLKKEVLRTERFRLTLNDFNIDSTEILHKLSDGYVELSPKQTALFPETIETLKSLKNDNFNMHIITNGFKEVQYIKLENSGLDHYFDVILCSEEVGHNKPSLHIFQYALKKAGAKASDSVMIGDDFEVDIIGALNAGMQGILFDPEDKYSNYQDTMRIKQLDELTGLLPWVFRTPY